MRNACLGIFVRTFCGAYLGISVASGEPTAVRSPSENPPSIHFPEREGAEGKQSDVRLLAEPSVEWELHKTVDGSHPDGNEQAMVWMMNRARSKPESEGLFLADSGDAEVNSAISFFKVNLDVMKDEFAAIPARQPAAFDRRIYEGSRVHSEDLIARNAQDHNNQFNRIDDAGFVASGANASVFSFSESPVQAHAAFNIDWGGGTPDGMQTGRGHRQGLMDANGGTLANVGIAMVPHEKTQGSVGPLVTSIVYARASAFAENHFNKFLVGTVWTDANENGLYDPGEGLAGVTVMPNSGTYFAVTGDAGGYAIPVSLDGEYSLTFSGGDLAEPETRTATVEGESVLVVWDAADSYVDFGPGPIVVPEVMLDERADGVFATWRANASYEYALERFSAVEDAWLPDDRELVSNGGEMGFLISSDEAAAGVIFRVQITHAEASSAVEVSGPVR